MADISSQMFMQDCCSHPLAHKDKASQDYLGQKDAENVKQADKIVATECNPNDVTIKSANEVKEGEETKTMAILFVGNSAVGKTSLISKIKNNQFEPGKVRVTIDLTPTKIGATVRGQSYIVYLLDTAGMEKFRSIVPSFYRHGNGAMVVYDITNWESLQGVEYWNSTLTDHCSECKNDIKFPIILLGNKADLNEYQHYNGSQMASDDWKMDGFFKTSAKTGDGITDAVKMMISLIDDKYRDRLKLFKRNTKRGCQNDQIIKLQRSNQNDHDQQDYNHIDDQPKSWCPRKC